MTTALKGWKTYRLGELGQYINGRAFKPEEWQSTGRPIIRIQNLTDLSKPFNYCDRPVENRYIVKDGDLLISWSATLGSFIWDRGPAVLNQHIFKVVPNAELVEKDFLHYLMLNTLDAMAEHAHGIAMKHITKGKFEAIQVAIPSHAEQRRILQRIRDCILRIEEISHLRTESQRQSTAVLPSVLHSVFETEAKTAPMRTIGALAYETRYGTSSKCDAGASGTPVLRIPNVAQGAIRFEDLKYCDLRSDELARLRLEEGDLLFVRTNGSRDLVGRSAIFEGSPAGEVFAYASYLIRVRLYPERVLPRYVGYFLNSTKGRAELDKRRRTSAGQFNINSENLRTIPIPVPSLQQQTSILQQLQAREAAAMELVDALAKSTTGATVLRDAVLRRAFAGEL